MAEVQAGVRRQGVDACDGIVQQRGVSARKIAPRGPVTRREQRVADECRVFHQVGDAVTGVARCFHDTDYEATETDGVALGQQAVKLAAVRRHVVEVEDPDECFLDGADAPADGDFRTRAFADVRGGRKVIGVGVCFEHPFDLESSFTGQFENAIGETGVGRSADHVENPHRIDDRRDSGVGIGHQVGPGKGFGFVERGDFQSHRSVPDFLEFQSVYSSIVINEVRKYTSLS